jgi:hypothetical protein
LNPESQSLATGNKAKGSKQAAAVAGGGGGGAAAAANDADADLEARLEALRRQ